MRVEWFVALVESRSEPAVRTSQKIAKGLDACSGPDQSKFNDFSSDIAKGAAVLQARFRINGDAVLGKDELGLLQIEGFETGGTLRSNSSLGRSARL